MDPEDVKVNLINCELILQSPQVSVNELIVILTRENNITSKFHGFLSFLILLLASLDIEFFYTVVFSFFRDRYIESLLILQSLQLELLLGVLVQELPLIIYGLQNSPAHNLRFLFVVQNKLCVLFKSINEFLVINIVEALSNVKHILREVFGVNILIQPFFNSCLLDYHVSECF